MNKYLDRFSKYLVKSIETHSFIKLVVSDRKEKGSEVQKVLIRQVRLKRGVSLSFVYRYQTKDITKNYGINEGVERIQELLQTAFNQSILFTKFEEIHLIADRKITVTKKAESCDIVLNQSHNREKNRRIVAQNNIYLKELGVLTSDWKVKQAKQDKFRQINKYIEIIEGIIKDVALDSDSTIVDMGAGKGYLTFSLYDYLTNSCNLSPTLIGVELRENLVEMCNTIAKKAGFQKLQFQQGTIEDAKLPKVDMLIALHACNTATDDAIFRGITAGAKLIVCSPCCHKQIRSEIAKDNQLKSITRFGILLERQAEIVTDAIRALYLEAFGYKTNVFEFISTEHTPKNLIISAVKVKHRDLPDPDKLAEIKALKAIFGIQTHYLETLNWDIH